MRFSPEAALPEPQHCAADILQKNDHLKARVLVLSPATPNSSIWVQVCGEILRWLGNADPNANTNTNAQDGS
ncbi:unnamed protein product [Fusarium graminearum]|uniref:Chromosome 4, complete genome n=2 Tax=Gibberella zeae TaxID=5518 RepID=A0A098DS21_GIBZE|nr:unnamed protein product [Fusarium graminearum]CAF3632027.1 unnamed protein product [Fusarium graminearum]CAG1971243.1 unnamed protein product [Fusarium graminearum]CAG1984602.1 unnamed protein product [Fusarium graminearum]CAG1990841.1 unnamed protein product [Fusarium graminearum]